MKTAVILAILTLGVDRAVAQEKPEPKAPAHEHLAPDQALDLLKEAQGLMMKSEDLLNDSSRGKVGAMEEAILRRINEQLKDDPVASQKKILEKIAKLMQKSEESQKDAIERMDVLIRKAKPCAGGS
jgi:hypothetical protein